MLPLCTSKRCQRTRKRVKRPLDSLSDSLPEMARLAAQCDTSERRLRRRLRRAPLLRNVQHGDAAAWPFACHYVFRKRRVVPKSGGLTDWCDGETMELPRNARDASGRDKGAALEPTAFRWKTNCAVSIRPPTPSRPDTIRLSTSR